MVKEVKGMFQCEECGFLYKEKSWAEKCEAFCRKYNSCSLDIIKHAAK
jgi:predicted ATP-dependent serine protease